MAGSKPRPVLQPPEPSQTVAAGASRPPQPDQNGSIRALNPATTPRSDVEVPRRRSPELSLSTKVPDYVMQQLRRRYADTNITIRVQILLALRRDGLEINDDDLVDERKHPRRSSFKVVQRGG